MNRRLLIIGGAIVVLFGIIFSFGFRDKCPDPADNIPGTPGYRDDCVIESTNVSDTEGVIDLWVLYDNTEAFQEQIQAFQSNNPGLRVNLKKFVNLQEYEELLINEIAEGEGPDVFMIHNSWMEKHAQKLFPLPPDQAVVMSPDAFRQTFFQAAIDDLIIDEQIYGMPLSIDNLVIYYNKSYFEDFIASSDSPADLWEQLQAQVIALTESDNSPERFARAGIAMGRADNINNAVDILYALMMQFGVEFYDDQEQQATFANNKPGTAGVSNPGVTALELYTSFGLPGLRQYSWNENLTGLEPSEKELNPFVRGKVAMVIGYSYMYENIASAIDLQQRLGNAAIDLDDVGIAPFPQLLSTEEATSRDTYASYFPLVVARTSDRPAQAWDLIKFLTTADSLQTYHNKTNRPTSRKDMVNDQQIEPLFGTFAFQAPFAKSFTIYDDAAYRRVFSDAIQAVVNNTQTAQEALSEAQEKITCIVQKAKGSIDIGTDCQI